jgi:hypothetical protein
VLAAVYLYLGAEFRRSMTTGPQPVDKKMSHEAAPVRHALSVKKFAHTISLPVPVRRPNSLNSRL